MYCLKTAVSRPPSPPSPPPSFFLPLEKEESNLLWKLIFILNSPPKRTNHLSNHCIRSSGSSFSCNQRSDLHSDLRGKKTHHHHTTSHTSPFIIAFSFTKTGPLHSSESVLCAISKMGFGFFGQHFQDRFSRPAPP